MQSSTDVPFDPPFKPQPAAREALVQDRPTLGAMPMAKRGPGLWLMPLVDLVSSSVALAVVAAIAGVAFLPAFPVAPVVLLAVYAVLGVYGMQSTRAEESGGGGILPLGRASGVTPSPASIDMSAMNTRSMPSSSAPSFLKSTAIRTSRSAVVLPSSAVSRSRNASNVPKPFAS